MYVVYHINSIGEGFIDICYRANMMCGLGVRPSESQWIIPGTVDPLDD